MFRPLCAALALAVTLVLGSGCATPLRLEPTTRSPSTDAWLTVTGDENNNSVISIKVEHLPPPARLGPDLKTYVVWVLSTDGAFVANVGMLYVNEEQKGSMSTTTPLREFLVRITAEQGGAAMNPSSTVVVEGAARRP